MEARALFDRVRLFWPDAIILGRKTPGSDHKPFWSVVHAYEAIEVSVSCDPWLEVGAWAFHQALTDLAQAKLSVGQQTVRPGSVTIDAFDAYMQANLADESWALERAMYVPLDNE